MTPSTGPGWGAGALAPGITEPDIVAVAQSVWQTVLGLELRGLGPRRHPPAPEPSLLRATVLISGTVEGSVSLELSSDAGRFVTGLLFGLEPREVSAEETADALGELANMIGGNLKMLVDQPAKLSLPAVVHGGSSPLCPPAPPPVHRIALGFDDNVVHVVLHTRRAVASDPTPQIHRSSP